MITKDLMFNRKLCFYLVNEKRQNLGASDKCFKANTGIPHRWDPGICFRGAINLKIIFLFLFLIFNTLLASEQSTTWLKAKQHAEQANEAFERANRFVHGWLEYQDENTKLLPQRLSEDRGKWTIHNSAADLYPRMVLAAYLTDRNLLNEKLLPILEQEQLLTNRLANLPDDMYIDNAKFVYDKIDTNRLIFGASEYCKDGLLMITELMGRTPWYDRMVQLVHGIWQIASVETPYGNIPSDNAEVNGEMLMVLIRLFTMTGDEKYLDLAERIGDTYLLHIMPKNHDLPAHQWDFKADTSKTSELRLSDHGNEILSGLALLYAIERKLNREKANQYYQPLKCALDRALEIGTNADGLFYVAVNPATGEVTNKSLTDTWGYVYITYYAFYQATGEKKYRRIVEQVLNRVTNYRDYKWPGGVDGLADCLEGALYLVNRENVQLTWSWLDKEVQRLFAQQQPSGIITGVYNSDNSFARVALMYGRAKTGGTYMLPWQNDLYWGAVYEDGMLNLYMRSDQDWEGTLFFDPPRHSKIIGLPQNYARLNEFQEWYTTDSTNIYYVTGLVDSTTSFSGKKLINGIQIHLDAGQEKKIVVRKSLTINDSGIRQYYLYVSTEDSIELYSRDVWSKQYLGPGRFVHNGRIYDDVLFRFRGHFYGRGDSQGRLPNKSFKIKFPTSKFEGITRNLDLNVIWQFTKEQGGVYRSKLPLDIFALAGYPAPKTRWCEFYLNDNYKGLFMEQEEIDSGPFLEHWFGDDNGNLYRFDKVSVDSAGHKRFWREINVEDNVDWSDFDHFMQVIEDSNLTTFWDEIKQMLDIPRFLDHAALNMLCSVSDLYNYGTKQSWDILRTHEVLENPMMYYDMVTNKFVLVPWDANSSLWNNSMEILPEPWTKEHLLGYILVNPDWRLQYKNLLRHYLSSLFTIENINVIIDDIYNDVREAMVRHNERWQDIYGYYDLKAEREQIKNFIRIRRNKIGIRLNEDDRNQIAPVPFNISWFIDPPLRNGSDFAVTADWGYGKPYYLDRDYVFLEVNPIIRNGVMLQTFNNLKRDSLVASEDREKWTCTVTIDTPVVAYLLWDHRSAPFLPTWLSSDQWSATAGIQQTSDYSMEYFDILRAYFQTNEPIILGHHQAGGIPEPFVPGSMYVVIFVPLSQPEFPAGYRIWQNYPNPFNNQTTIRYSLLDAGEVKLAVFNVLGQKVRTLVNERQSPGFYDVKWNGKNEQGMQLASGLYSCRLKVNERVGTIKMLLIR